MSSESNEFKRKIFLFWQMNFYICLGVLAGVLFDMMWTTPIILTILVTIVCIYLLRRENKKEMERKDDQNSL